MESVAAPAEFPIYAVRFEEKLKSFVASVQEMINASYAKNFPSLTPPVITVEPGRVYIKLVKTETFGSGRSVYCFVDKATGSILKAASWSKPAKWARGSIFAQNPLTGVTEHGAVYR